MYPQATGIVTTLTTLTTTGGDAAAAPAANPDPGCGSPSVAQLAAQDGGGSAAWGGYENGRIPASALCPVPSAPGLLLECGAAAAFDQLNTAFRAVFGQDIGITDAYRSYDEQVACRAEKGRPVRRPGHQQPRLGQGGGHRRLLRREHRIRGGVRLADRERRPVRLGPPAVGATRRVETRTVALGIRGDPMNWQPQPGTEAITSWINQGALFALVLAVAAVVARARTGVAVSLAAALLLGGGFTYVQWTSSQARSFAGDPKDYAISDAQEVPGVWEFLDLSERWTGDIHTVRATDGLPPFSTDRGLVERARSCASSRARQGGDSRRNYFSCREGTGMVFGAWVRPGGSGQAEPEPGRGVHPAPEPVGRRRHPADLGPVRGHAVGVGGDAGQRKQEGRRRRPARKRCRTEALERAYREELVTRNVAKMVRVERPTATRRSRSALRRRASSSPRRATTRTTPSGSSCCCSAYGAARCAD